MSKPKEKGYCKACKQKRKFIHKSVMVGYECKVCGTPYGFDPSRKITNNTTELERATTT